jgi:hypothetical protein
MELLYAILGWLSGLLSPSIINRISRSYSRRELFNGIKVEMKECQFRVLLVANLLGLRFGRYDKEYLSWCLPYLQNYRGSENPEGTLKAVLSFLEAKEEDVEHMLALKRSMEKGLGLNLKRFHLPFLDSKMGEVSSFRIELQNIIYEIRSRLQIINEEIDSAIEYFRMTFDSSISTENHRIIKESLRQKYVRLQDQLVILVKKMDKCLNYEKI